VRAGALKSHDMVTSRPDHAAASAIGAANRRVERSGADQRAGVSRAPDRLAHAPSNSL